MNIVDQLGRAVDVPDRARRIVSLCPSTTETLCALGVEEQLVGRTDFCTRPASLAAGVPTVGGTKTVRLPDVEALAPDLVVAVREENDREQVEVLAERYPVLVLDPIDIGTAIEGVAVLGRATGTDGESLAAKIRASFDALPKASEERVLYLIWRKPYMAAGASTYVDDVLRHVGFVNAAAAWSGRYPAVPDGAGEVDLVLASSEPFPFDERYRPELERRFPAAAVHLVDGEVFSWHGYRMLDAARQLDAFVTELRAE